MKKKVRSTAMDIFAMLLFWFIDIATVIVIIAMIPAWWASGEGFDAIFNVAKGAYGIAIPKLIFCLIFSFWHKYPDYHKGVGSFFKAIFLAPLTVVLNIVYHLAFMIGYIGAQIRHKKDPYYWHRENNPPSGGGAYNTYDDDDDEEDDYDINNILRNDLVGGDKFLNEKLRYECLQFTSGSNMLFLNPVEGAEVHVEVKLDSVHNHRINMTVFLDCKLYDNFKKDDMSYLRSYLSSKASYYSENNPMSRKINKIVNYTKASYKDVNGEYYLHTSCKYNIRAV